MLTAWQNVTMPDDATLGRWFCDDRRNIGIVCGAASGRLVVVDWDDLAARLQWLTEVNPPITLTVTTGSGGVHDYYRVTGKMPGNRKLVGGDLRGQGGQVVAPPSLHLSGRRYEWRDVPGSLIAVVDLADLRLPFAGAQRKEPPARAKSETGTHQGIGGILHYLAQAQEGTRNDATFWAACKLRDHGVPLTDADSLIGPVAVALGLPEAEAARTIASAYTGGRA